MPTLKNINWPEIALATTQLARAVKFADAWAERAESAMHAGLGFDAAVERAYGDAKHARHDGWDPDVDRIANGLMYATWARGDEFREWFRRKHGQDLREYSSTLHRAPTDARSMGERHGRSRKLWLPGDLN